MPLRQRLLLLSALPIFYLLHRRLHRHHAGHGHHEPQVCQDSSWDPLFWGFMLAHSFLDGFFLRLSFRYSPYLVQVSIVTLILHRATEALFLATLGTAVRRYARRRSLFAYLVAFPAGAYTLDFFLTHPEIMQLSTYSLSIAAGSVMTLTLLGLLVCLLSDSLLPAWQKSQGSHPESRWSLLGVMAGFLLTFCFFKLGFLV